MFYGFSKNNDSQAIFKALVGQLRQEMARTLNKIQEDRISWQEICKDIKPKISKIT